MTEQQYFTLFSKAMMERKIVRHENSTSRDDYYIYAIRKTPSGYLFFCLLETFFRTEMNSNSWFTGSIKSFQEFYSVEGATKETLILSSEHFEPFINYKEKLPAPGAGELSWVTVD